MKYMKNCKWLFASYLLLVPVSTVTSVLFSLGLEPLINVASANDWAHFAGYLLLELVFALADVGANYLHRISRERMRFYYVTGLRRDCFEAVMDKNIADFYRHADSEYLSALNRDVDKLNRNVFDSACGFYKVAVGFLIHLYVILRANVWIVLVNIVLSFVSVTIPRFFEKKLIEAQNTSSRASENYYGNLNDALRGFTTIKIFGISDVIRKRMEAANRHLEEANYRSFRKNYSVSCISMLCTNISYVLTIGAGVYFTLTGRMSVGQIIAVSQLMGGIAVPFEELPVLLSNYRSVTDVRQKLLDMIRMRRQNAPARCEASDKPPKTIELKDVSFRFEKQEKGFEHLNYVFEADQKYIVLGESGSGKSTLAKLLSGFYRCDAGEISMDHDNIDQMSEESLYRRVNYIEQRVFLFNDTLRSNITMYRDYDLDEIENAVRLAGLKELVDRLPQHLETLVEGNGVNFSGGEMQRIAIARAILAKSQFIIFDEATANMDTALAREIEEIIMNLEHTGIIYITHHQSEELLRAADHVLTMKDWCIVIPEKIFQQGRSKAFQDNQGLFFHNLGGIYMLKDRYSYVAVFSYDDDGICIEFPDLPGCCPCADAGNTDMALKNAKEAMGLHIWSMEQDDEEIPAPTPITAISLESHQVPVLIEVFMPPVRERINNKFVKKTLSLPAWLAARADEDGVNCSKIFQNALMEYLHVQ